MDWLTSQEHNALKPHCVQPIEIREVSRDSSCGVEAWNLATKRQQCCEGSETSKQHSIVNREAPKMILKDY
jgi:hypothetical protein